MQKPTLISSNSSVDLIMIKKVIEELERGKESAHLINTLFLQLPRVYDQDCQNVLDRHSMVVLDTYANCLSMLRRCISMADSARKRKFDRLDCYENDKSEESSRDSSKNRRGSCKRSRTDQSRIEEVTHLIDDGFVWRKYGQKDILKSKHPRNYYRCTHKHEHNCQATKHIQQISENPSKYKIIYHGNHSCNNILKTSPIIINSPEEHSSTFFLSFGSNNTPSAKHALNSSLFPISTFPSDSYGVSSHSSASSDYQSNCQDVKETSGLSSTSVSDQSDVISAVDYYSSTSSFDGMEEDYSHIWADCSEVLQDWLAK